MRSLSVIFRTDSSVTIGSGHVMRCLTLADVLRRRGADCLFICSEHEGNLFGLIRDRGFAVVGLPVLSDWASDAAQSKVSIGKTVVDWLIVDHYSLDARWEKEMRLLCHNLMVIDDLADRPHDCDLMLDQNYYRNQNQRYDGLIPEHCVSILGPAYVLLRQEFQVARQQLKLRDGTIQRILVFFGGSDPANQTQLALKALEQLQIPGISVDVVVGASNPNRDSIRTLCERLSGVTYHCNVSNMAELIANADLGIGAGGSAMWERCFLGLPTITVVSADNQLLTTEDMAELGAIDYIGKSDSIAVDDYVRVIIDAMSNPQRLKQISDTALSVVTEESTFAVVDKMCNLGEFNFKNFQP